MEHQVFQQWKAYPIRKNTDARIVENFFSEAMLNDWTWSATIVTEWSAPVKVNFSEETAGRRQMTDGRTRSHIKPGQTVSIVLKRDQRTGTLTEGIVKNILTKSPQHPHGIKVRLENGQVGRVKVIHE